MSRTLPFLIALLSLLPAAVFAQANDRPDWDAGVTAGLLNARPEHSDRQYDHWYFEGRYAASLGRYWSPHLKTEIEFATSSEGSRYGQRLANTAGVPSQFTYGVSEFVQLNQLAGRAVWQFGDNAWVHPYVFGGVTYDLERQREATNEQFYYASSTPQSAAIRIPIATASNQETRLVHRIGATAGFGAKIYVSPKAFFNTAVVASAATGSRTVSFTGGFGMDF